MARSAYCGRSQSKNRGVIKISGALRRRPSAAASAPRGGQQQGIFLFVRAAIRRRRNNNARISSVGDFWWRYSSLPINVWHRPRH